MALVQNLLKLSKLCNLYDFTKISKAGSINNSAVIVSVRTSKHYNPKFKWLRGQKVIKIPLPFTEKNKKESHRSMLYKMGVVPRYWRSRPMTITGSQEIFDAYEPPEGDSKVSILSSKKITEVTTTSKSKIFTINAIRRIKSYDPKFDAKLFPQEAQDIYVKAHTVLMKKNAEDLSEYVTEFANMKMMEGIKNYTLKWNFLESLEPPKLVQARFNEVLKQSNLFAQVTVKFHTKQTLAMYDRFGRLTYGSETLAKDVLEYVVFEKHINNEYGEWRLHAKIIPNWVPRMSFNRTYRVPEYNIEDDEDDAFEDFVEEDQDVAEDKATTEIVQPTQTSAVN